MTTTIDLNGVWTLGWFDGSRGAGARLVGAAPQPDRFLEAHVPGEVHLDLIRAGLLAEPNNDLNCYAARWVEETIWYYQRTFTAPPLAAGERAWLYFGGLDLAAVIYLNGQEVARHTNSFYPCRVEVSDTLLPGENRLTVQVESGIFWASDKPGQGYSLAPDSQLKKRNWLRKVQSSFGWDWSTQLLNVGVSGDVRLEIASLARLDSLVVLSQPSDDLSSAAITARVFVEGLAETAQPGELVVEVEGLAPRAFPVTVQPGLQRLEASVELPEPRLWWPAGHGAQPLYRVRAALSVNRIEIGSAVRRTGVRKVRVNQSPHSESGSYFIFEINDKPIFVKGGNFVPADMIPARLDRARYAVLVDRAVEANCNMLRIWGGGLYESDDFYELCDERGILVWQEFIFACARYPAFDEHFLADIKHEAAYQVRRLAHHPSLIAWCGNNEMEEGNYHWGYDKGVAHPDYAVFHLVLPLIVREEDGTHYYQPSSPFSPNLESPRRDDMGDQHPWSLGFADTDFRKYRQMACRFPNEGGTLGPNSLPTVRACLPTGQEYPGSFAFQVHDNGIASWGDTVYPDDMLVQWLGKSIASMSIEDYVYWGGVIQGEGLGEYIRNFRRRMFDTSSAIFWMYNDNWPTTRSWTIVDYYLRRTPAFYPVKRAFQPLTVAIAVEDSQVRVFGVNEGPAWSGEVRFGVLSLEGGYPVDFKTTVDLPGNTSTLVGEFSLEVWQRLGEASHAAYAILSQGGTEVARDSLFLPYYKEITWPKAEVSVRIEQDKAIFESSVFAWRVCLDLDGEQALPDNFFDIYPGIPTILNWHPSLGAPKVLYIGNAIGGKYEKQGFRN